MLKKYTHLPVLVTIFLVVILLVFTGCAQENKSFPNSADTSNRNLLISLAVNKDAPSFVFTSDDLNGNFTEGLEYSNVSNVVIYIDGKTVNLEEAIRTGSVTAEEIFCFARLDARSGICKETYESRNGLTHFTYSYPEYTLRLIYDIYETPDGKQHLISDMGLYPPNTTIGTYTHFYLGDVSIARYDLEDWGLTFSVTDVTPSGVCIMVDQSGGQQIGDIRLSSYYLGKDENTPVDKLNGIRESEYIDFKITLNGSTEISIDWTDAYGNLPSGQYLLDLSFVDIYTTTDVHPLMRNYYDDMSYILEINIP